MRELLKMFVQASGTLYQLPGESDGDESSQSALMNKKKKKV